MDDLCKTIKMGFAFGLKENDVDLLPVTKNLELVPVDASCLECAFHAAKVTSLVSMTHCTPVTKKQRRD